MIKAAAPPPEAPFRPGDFRRLWALAAAWDATYRYRPAAAELGEILRQVEAARTEGPDVLDAHVSGGSIPELRDAALAKARELWGEKADPAVERISTVDTWLGRHGPFRAHVRVRCLNYAEIS